MLLLNILLADISCDSTSAIVFGIKIGLQLIHLSVSWQIFCCTEAEHYIIKSQAGFWNKIFLLR